MPYLPSQASGDTRDTTIPLSGERIASSSGLGGRNSIEHRYGPAVQASPPVPLPDSLFAEFMSQPMPDADDVVIIHAPPPRETIPSVTFTLPGDVVHATVKACASQQLLAGLIGMHRDRVATLLSVPSSAWQAPTIEDKGEGLFRLAYRIDDPQATPGGGSAPIPIEMDVQLPQKPGQGQPEIIDMLIGEQGDALLLPVLRCRRFTGGDTSEDVLVPHKDYPPEQLAMLRSPAHGTVFTPRGQGAADVHFTFFDTSNPAAVVTYDAKVSIRRHGVVGAWMVEGITVQEKQLPTPQLQAACMEWLRKGVDGPQLPDYVVEDASKYLKQQLKSGTLPPDFEFVSLPGSTDPVGMRLSIALSYAVSFIQPEVWNLTLSFVPDGQDHVVAVIVVHDPRSTSGYQSFMRSHTDAWTNPLAPRETGGTSTGSAATEATTLSTQSSETVHERPQLEGPEGTAKRPRYESTSSAFFASASALKIREQQQQFLLLRDLEAPYGIGSSSVPPGTGAKHDSVFISQQAYRVTYGLAEDAPVCAAIAAGVVLDRPVSFSEFKRFNPQAHTTGTGDAQVKAIMNKHAPGWTEKAFDQMTDTPGEPVAQQLKAHLETLGHDAAWLHYRLNVNDKRPANAALAHHVALYREGTQWKLFDGLVDGQDGGRAMSMEQVVQNTYGQNQQGGSRLEVYSWKRPRKGEGGTTATEGQEKAATPAAAQTAPPPVQQTPPLQLSAGFTATVNAPWAAALLAEGLQPSHLPCFEGVPGHIDWGQVAQDLVDAAIRHGLQKFVPQERLCMGMPMPDMWPLGATAHAGKVINLSLTLTPDRQQVTDIHIHKILQAPSGPAEVEPDDTPAVFEQALQAAQAWQTEQAQAAQTMAPGATPAFRVGGSETEASDGFLMATTSKSIYTTLKKYREPLLDVLEDQYTRQAHWRPVGNRIVEACAGLIGTFLDYDKDGLPIYEFCNVMIHGVVSNVRLRYLDTEGTSVYDFRLYDPTRPTPHFRWNRTPDAN